MRFLEKSESVLQKYCKKSSPYCREDLKNPRYIYGQDFYTAGKSLKIFLRTPLYL